MKRNRYILLAAAILAAMSTVSCEKETPYYTETSTSQETTQYNLSVGEVPSFLKEGTEETFSVVLKTNLPSTDLVIETESWIGASIMDGALTISVGRNETKDVRTGRVLIGDRKGRVSPVYFNLKQDYILTNAEGMVQFKDKAFKKAMLALADKDGDGDVSPEEALSVDCIEAAGLGIRDISGIEAFRNIWKLDLGNNDIDDATLVKEHPYLHWLNLKGNRNLKTFDVRGCTSYFEVCDFEVTDDLQYYLYYRTMGVTWPDDKDCRHSHHSRDPRLTRDWTREGECYEVYHHTKGPGKLGIVFSGIGWIDVDVNDGTFERIVHEAIGELKKQPGWADNWEFFDVYVYVHMAEKRCQWMYWDELIGKESKEEEALVNAYNEHRKTLWKQMEESINNKYCYKITIDSHSNMMVNTVVFNGENISHIVPINGFDHSKEEYYNYMTIKEAATYKNFPIGQNQWQDWQDFD